MIRNYDENALLESSGLALLFNLILSVYTLGSLNHAHAKIACPGWAERVAREKARASARDVAIIWDMRVFINQLIECEIYFKRYFNMDWNNEFLFCYYNGTSAYGC